MKKPSRLLLGLAVAACLAAPSVQAAPATSPLDRPAMTSAKASKSLLIDVASAGQRLVAVG